MAIYPPIQFKRTSITGRTPTDSDLVVGEIAINLVDGLIFTKNDSDNIVQIGKLNNDKIIHDYQAGDSDLLTTLQSEIARVIGEHDSDGLVTNANHDSDVTQIIHDYKASDSDILVLIADSGNSLDSEILARKAADSDILVLISSNVNALDSEILARKSADSDLSSRIDNVFDSLDSEISVRFANDSDIRVLIANEVARVVSEHDSDIGVTNVDHDSDIAAITSNYRNADSDLKASVDSDIANLASALSELTDVDVITVTPTHGQTIIWDSDSELWKPGEGGTVISSINDLSDVDTNTVTPIDKHYLAWDSDNQAWTPRFIGSVANLDDLGDVTAPTPQHGEALSWDSDSQAWKPTSQTVTSYASRKVVDLFVATQNQTQFVLSQTPYGDVEVTRNGIVLPIDAFVDSENIIDYLPIYNNNSQIDSDDDIQVSYVYVSSVDTAILANTLTLGERTSPPTPAEGMMAIADGTLWDPASTGTKTLVIYLNGSWNQIV